MKKAVAILLLLCVLCSGAVVSVSAEGYYEIPVEIIGSEETQERWEAYQITRLTEAEAPGGKNIYYMDVNDQGDIIASFYRGKKIGVYNKDGEYQYGYSLNTSGYFAAKWVDDSGKIMIYYLLFTGRFYGHFRFQWELPGNGRWNGFQCKLRILA